MICPNCRNEIPDNSTVCSRCGTPILHPRVIEAEVISDDSGREREVRDAEYEAPRQAHFTRVFYSTFPGGGRGSVMPTSCLPTFISLGLALIILLKYDLAYAIAFLVFAAIGRAITFFMTIQHWMQGRAVNQWMLHIVTWGICWALIAWIKQS